MNDKTSPAATAAETSGVAEPTVGLFEKHKTIYIRTVKGWWNNWRWIFVLLTQLIFYGLPWLAWNGRQAVLLHLAERKFYIFGLVLWPQDVFYLSLILIVSAYSLFLFTAVAGRLFCGYACPQTVYTEIFMWIERKIEGERSARMKLDAAPMSGRKFAIKFAKHAAWIVLALWTGFTFVGYFTPIHELVGEVARFEISGWALFWMIFYGAFAYLMAGFMREQVCKYMCPYARFQSVMFDPDTLIITYDPKRGEPRGARKKGGQAQSLGDCIDCNLCVHACPTGIDIRNGLQYECIGCGACIDACDEVMDKVKQPRGLIRYTSENALYGKTHRTSFWSHVLRPRIMVYTAILCVIFGGAVWSFVERVPLRADIIRDRNTLTREVHGMIENLYIIKVMNVSEKPRDFKITVSGLPGIKLAVDSNIVKAEAAENHEVVMSVQVPPDDVSRGAHKIYFEVTAVDDPKVQVKEKSTFLVL